MSSSPFPASSSYYAFPPMPLSSPSLPMSPNPSTSRSNTSSRPRPSLALSSISTTPSNREAIKSRFEPILFATNPKPKSLWKTLFKRRASNASSSSSEKRNDREKSPTPSELSEEEVEVIREMWEDWVARF